MVSIDFQPTTLVSFLLVMTRLLAVFFIAPPFSGAGVPVQVRLALAGSIGLLVAPQQNVDVSLDVLPLMMALVYQVVVGTAFGYLVNVLLSAPVVAGTLVDHLTGFSAATLFDPFTQSASSPAGRVNQLVALVILLVLEGHLLIVRGVLRSYEAAPLAGLNLDALAAGITEAVGQLIVAAIEISLPVTAALLMAEVVMGLAAKAAPKLNVMVVGFAVKSAVFMVAFSLSLPLLVNAVSTLLTRSLRWAMAISGV